MQGLVTYVLLPAWIVPGVLDWWFHRRTRIEATAGARESALHLLMQAEAGIPVMAFLFLEIDAVVVLAGLLAAALHEATVVWDVAYTTPRRKIAPAEQHTHSFLEALPVHDGGRPGVHAARARRARCSARGPERPRFAFRPPAQAAAGVLRQRRSCSPPRRSSLLPHAEEFVRCWKAAPTLGRRPVPPLPPTTDAQRWTREHDAEGWEV